MKLERIETSRHQIPLPQPIEAASAGVMRAFDLVAVRLTDEDGATGCGYTVMHAGQGGAVAHLLETNFAPLALAEDPRRIEWIWTKLWQAHHYLGRGGPVSFALAALDTALWDLRGRQIGRAHV